MGAQKKPRGPPSSSLASAKKRSIKAKNEKLTQALISFGDKKHTSMDDMRFNWSSCKFTDNNADTDAKDDNEGMIVHQQQKENMDTDKVVGNAIEEQKQKHVPLSNVSNIKRPSAFMNSGEASDDDSSLLLDENHEDESSEDHQHGNKKWNGQQNNFNFDNQ